MNRYLKRIPWAFLTLLTQVVIAGAAYHLYSNDYGYANGRAFSHALSFSYTMLGSMGILGFAFCWTGMVVAILYNRWWWCMTKLIFIYIPCMLLSVTWLYTWMVLLAWI